MSMHERRWHVTQQHQHNHQQQYKHQRKPPFSSKQKQYICMRRHAWQWLQLSSTGDTTVSTLVRTQRMHRKRTAQVKHKVIWNYSLQWSTVWAWQRQRPQKDNMYIHVCVEHVLPLSMRLVTRRRFQFQSQQSTAKHRIQILINA